MYLIMTTISPASASTSATTEKKRSALVERKRIDPLVRKDSIANRRDVGRVNE